MIKKIPSGDWNVTNMAYWQWADSKGTNTFGPSVNNITDAYAD